MEPSGRVHWLISLLVAFLFPTIVDSDPHCRIPCETGRYCCGLNECCIISPHHRHIWGLWYFWLTLGLLIVACIICCGYLRKKNNQRRESTGVIVYSAQSNAVNYLPNETAATYSTTNTTHYMTSAPAYSTTHYVTSPPVYRETVTTLPPGYPHVFYTFPSPPTSSK